MASSKPDLARAGTMQVTAKEAEGFLAEKGRVDQDATTRGQQKKIDEIKAEKPPTKKAKLARDSTMAATAKEAKGLLAGEKLADTRQETKAKRKSKGGMSSAKRASAADKIVAEAKVLYSDLDQSEGRSLRKRPPRPTPTLKKAGTMQATAKEGKAFLKRSKKSK